MNKVSFGFVFLFFNLLILISFYYWVMTPMWYGDVGYRPFLSDTIPRSKESSIMLKKQYREYLKKIGKIKE